MKYLLFVLTLLVPFTYTNAQVNLNFANGTNELTIDLNTNYISPLTEITASLNDYSQASQSSKVYWKIDGKSAPEFNNQRSIKLKTKNVGEITNLQVFVETTNKQTISAKKTLNPVYLDIIVEPQTRVPDFYRGRALPSNYSSVNFTALINGNTTNSEQYIYNWDLNGKNLEGGAISGKYKTSAILGINSFNTLTLSVSKASGELVAKRSIEISPVEPTISFYEVNALYGISELPIKQNFNLLSNSVLVRAEPYYLDINTYNKPQYVEWKIDGVRNPNRNNNPYEVTLAKQGGSGKTDISFHVRNLDEILQGAQNSFSIKY